MSSPTSIICDQRGDGMTLAEWRFKRFSNTAYRAVRLDFLRISILTGNTASVWQHDEFVLGFLCTRIADALQHYGVSGIQQRDEILLDVLTRLVGRSFSASIHSATRLDGASHDLRFHDGIELARRLDMERGNRGRRRFVISNHFSRSLQLYGSRCVTLAAK